MSNAKRSVFRLLCRVEELVDLARGGPARAGAARLESAFEYGAEQLSPTAGRRSLIVFCPTIGEFNLVRPLINKFLDRFPGDTLVLFTAQEQYLGVLHKAYPEAIVGTPEIRSPRLLDRFVEILRPRLMILAEGPSLYRRHPQRLELPLPVALARHSIPVVVANAGLHEIYLQSRIDKLENRFFADLYRDAITRWYVASESFRAELIDGGVPAERIEIVGEIKFDSFSELKAPQSESFCRVLDHYRGCAGPVVVAGSVNAIDEQTEVIGAWKRLLGRWPDARLVLAPRYVNNVEVMTRLEEVLKQQDLRYEFRSRQDTVSGDTAILVIDVFGELPQFYSMASIAYIGRNHGVLEPLAFDCPTVVGSVWRRDYQSYPLYRLMIEENAIIRSQNAEQLGEIFIRLIEDDAYRMSYVDRAREVVKSHRGAAERTLTSLLEFVPQ